MHCGFARWKDMKSRGTIRSYPQAHAAEQLAAVDCDTAQQEMHKATTEREATVDYRKMKAFCSS